MSTESDREELLSLLLETDGWLMMPYIVTLAGRPRLQVKSDLEVLLKRGLVEKMGGAPRGRSIRRLVYWRTKR